MSGSVQPHQIPASVNDAGAPPLNGQRIAGRLDGGISDGLVGIPDDLLKDRDHRSIVGHHIIDVLDLRHDGRHFAALVGRLLLQTLHLLRNGLHRLQVRIRLVDLRLSHKGHRHHPSSDENPKANEAEEQLPDYPALVERFRDKVDSQHQSASPTMSLNAKPTDAENTGANSARASGEKRREPT